MNWNEKLKHYNYNNKKLTFQKVVNNKKQQICIVIAIRSDF